MNESKIQVVYRKTSDLIPYENNPRNNDDAVQYVAASIKEFGFKVPVIVDKDDVVVAGHTRLKAAEQLGIEEVPTIKADDLDEDQIRAFRLADNKTAEKAGWNYGLLELELGEITMEMEPFGFDDDILNSSNDDDWANQEINEQAEELINAAWQEHAEQFANQYDILSKNGFSFSGITKGLAKIKFIESKFYGKEYPRFLSLAFHPHQFITNGDNESAYDGLRDVAEGKIKVDRLRFVTGDDIAKITKGSLSFSGARMPLDFPASLARDLINEFSNGGKVLDPCHGWGGRLIGAMLADINEYTGVDPSIYQNDGVKDIYSTFKQYSGIQRVNIISAPFEDAEIEKDYYDFAITSPPYFDTEHYIGGEQSHERYDNYPLWRDGFYRKLIQKVYDALKDGCYFALQVGSQRYPLADDGITIATETGFSFIEKRGTDITNNFNQVDDTHAEVVLIFKKL